MLKPEMVGLPIKADESKLIIFTFVEQYLKFFKIMKWSWKEI